MPGFFVIGLPDNLIVIVAGVHFLAILLSAGQITVFCFTLRGLVIFQIWLCIISFVSSFF